MRRLGLLMMTRGEVPFADLWEDWLHGTARKCRIFVHAKVPDRIVSSLFANAVIPEYVQTTHGRDYPHNAHLIGMLALLREALRHPDIAKLAFLSESCLPIRPFGLCYQRLMIDDRSWICDWFAGSRKVASRGQQSSRGNLRRVPDEGRRRRPLRVSLSQKC